MAGKPGQVQKKARRNTGRQKIWQSMRIMGTFCIPDLMRTAETKQSNVNKFLLRLTAHGYVSIMAAYSVGSRQVYRLARNTGPDHPVSCDICGRPLQEPCGPREEL